MSAALISTTIGLRGHGEERSVATFKRLVMDVEVELDTVIAREGVFDRVRRQMDADASKLGAMAFWHEQKIRVQPMNATRLVRVYVRRGDS